MALDGRSSFHWGGQEESEPGLQQGSQVVPVQRRKYVVQTVREGAGCWVGAGRMRTRQLRMACCRRSCRAETLLLGGSKKKVEVAGQGCWRMIRRRETDRSELSAHAMAEDGFRNCAEALA